MKIIVTGITGSFGKEFAKQAIAQGHDVIGFSRDELKQSELTKQFPTLKLRLGDVRDFDRIHEVISEFKPDQVIHAAALKRIEVGEKIPSEVIKTNILGSMNIAKSARLNNCKLLALSTDKAAKPINLYGGTKLVMEKIITEAGGKIVRYGNVAGSRGSVIPTFLKLKESGKIPEVRDLTATRFLIRLEDAVKFVLNIVNSVIPSKDINIPTMKSAEVRQIADIIFGEGNYNVTNLIPGEKLHEDIDLDFDSNKAERFTNDELLQLIKEVKEKL